MPRVGSGVAGDLLRRAFGDDAAAAVAAFGAEVDDPVGGFDHVEVVLDDDDRVAAVGEALEHAEQLLDVGEVEPGGRFVEDVEGAAGGARGESSVASLTRWASPPESWVAGWPSWM